MPIDTDAKGELISSGDNSDLGKRTLKELIKMRGTIKGRLTRFKDHVFMLNEVEINEISDLQIKELKLRLNKIENLLFEFNEVQYQIEILSTGEDDSEIDSFENSFYRTTSLAQHIIESCNKIHDNDASLHSAKSTCSDSCNLNNIKLPTIKLPTFDGNYLKWLEFRDTFDSLIHSNTYLRSSLEGSASIIIKSIEFTAQNYMIAWGLICDRYDNKKVLINNHLKSLFEINPMTVESYKAIRFLVDHVSKNLRSLNTLNQPTDKWDIIIIYLVSTKLDSITFGKWEEYKNNFKDLPTLSDFMQFLRNRADILETVAVSKSDKYDYKPPNIKDKKYDNNQRSYYHHKTTKSFVTSSDAKPKLECAFCNQQHRIIDCSSFNRLSPERRGSEVLRLNLCSNCLRRGHVTGNCRLLGTCKICRQKHNTLLHINSQEPECQPGIRVPNNNINSLPVSLSTKFSNQVLLGTALVQVKNLKNNNTYLARALLNSGSQSSFITSNLKHKLGLISTQPDTFCVSGISGCQARISECCKMSVSSLTESYKCDVTCLVIPHITGLLPNTEINVSELNLPGNIELADPNFFHPSDVDLLLGAEIFFDVLTPNQITLGSHKPVLQSTKLGWMVAGPLCNNNVNGNKKIYCNFNKTINDQLAKFWQLEEISPTKPTVSPSDEFCEHHFITTTRRLKDGRFSVLMPFHECPEQSLGDSFNMARKRFFNLEKKLNKNPDLKQEYYRYIKEYEEMGHLNLVQTPQFGYFMPHHAVIKDHSETTKLRVVFDASAKTTSLKSLNEIQCIGPVVQDELFSILVRFRQHKYVLSGDIMKMYRQIMIDKSQRHLQLILWRDDVNTPLKTLQLNTVTYGTASAPYLSTRCLLQLALECNDTLVSEIIKHDFYIDDLLTGCSNEETLVHIHKSIIDVLASACFPIHKFRTNCPQLFSEITESESLDLSKESSVLGVIWAPATDTLRFQININENEQNLTKRIILSNTCKIFDPLGLLSACTITLKILLQRLWKTKLAWDDTVPGDIKNTWRKTVTNLNLLLTLSVPRFVMCAFPVTTELHCFVDASQDAYAACVYIRSINTNGKATVNLLCAKTRVAPLNAVTIPRLELCAALLGARLTTKVSEAFRCKISSKTFWSDSTITIGWIRTQTKLLKAFVCNRVNEIRELTDNKSWRHVPTDVNPADLASRGVEPKILVDSSLWWHGPPFLIKQESEWPQSQNITINLPEIKTFHIQNPENSFILFHNHSDPIKLKRIFAYIFRFIYNCKNSNRKIIGSLNENELQNSLMYLIKMCQQESFSSEIDILSKGKSLCTKSRILQLSPFIDDGGILRVGGRLNNADVAYTKKHPALLDAKHHYTKLLMSSEHLRLFHAGPQLLLSTFRETFWPIGGRALARSTVRKCVICTRLKGKTLEPYMGNLPKNRVSQTFPFQTTGVDFAGPFLIASKKGRGSRTTKCYLCLFICFSTKAIHLETVSDLSTSAFIACLKRFIARRGKPYYICCDNGKNFVGANNELGRILRSNLNSLTDFTANEGIKFYFNPPYSPTFGGLWEAGVKSAKHHLKRIAGNTSLTFEELSTLFTQIEAILNSRPLTPLSSDPSDLSPVTPGHFLIGRPLTSLPSPHTTGTNIRTRYQLIEQLRSHFWSRWNNEYLAELQQRTIWRSHNQNLKVGDMVVFKEPNSSPLKWKLGRVHQLYSGNDGVPRVADFLTQRGIERRALNRVCPLPVSSQSLDVERSCSSFQGGEDVNAHDNRGCDGRVRRTAGRGARAKTDERARGASFNSVATSPRTDINRSHIERTSNLL